MTKRILATVLSVMLLLGLMYVPAASGNIQGVSGNQTFRAIISPNGTIMPDIATHSVSPGEIFTVEFYAKGFDNIGDMTIPLLYDFGVAQLVDNAGNIVTTDSVNPSIITINSQYFELRVVGDLANPNYPLFRPDYGYIQLWLEPYGPGASSIDVAGAPWRYISVDDPNEGVFVLSARFRASTAPSAYGEEFMVREAVRGNLNYDSNSSWGITVQVLTPDSPYHITFPTQSAVRMNPIVIGTTVTDPPPYVFVHDNSDGTVTVIVRAPNHLPRTEIRLYDRETGGNLIAGPSVVNEDGDVIFINVPAGSLEDNRVWASAREEYRIESTRTPPSEHETRKVLMEVIGVGADTVLYNTPESFLHANIFPDQILVRFGIIVRDLLGQEIGEFRFPAPEYVDVDNNGWVYPNYSPTNYGVQFHFRARPALPPGVENMALPDYASHFIVVMPDGVPIDREFVVIFLNGSEVHSPIQVVPGGNLSTRPPVDPTRNGYPFLGWYIRNEAGDLVPWDFNTPITRHTVIQAVFDEDPDARRFTVSGRLWSTDTSFVGGGRRVDFTINGVAGHVTTNTDGSYLITNIPYGARVVITPPTIVGWNVNPSVRELARVISNVTYQDFVYTRVTTNGGPGPGPGPGPWPPGGIIPLPPGTDDPPDDPDVTLEREHHFRYIFGYPDGTVRPENNITREEVAAVFFRLLTTESRNFFRTNTHTFHDVEYGRWSTQQIATMRRAGILQGRPGGSFDPGVNITRAEFAAIAVRFDGLVAGAMHNFSDVSGHWAERYISSAVLRGWIVGYPDGTFMPDQPITRVEAMTLINRVLGRHVDTQGMYWDIFIDWPDLPRGHWGFYQVMEATISHNWVRRYPGNQYNLVENWVGRGDDVNFGELLWDWNPYTSTYVPRGHY